MPVPAGESKCQTSTLGMIQMASVLPPGQEIRPAFVDEGVLVAVGAAHFPERLGVACDRREARRHEAGRPCEDEPFLNELPAIVDLHELSSLAGLWLH